MRAPSSLRENIVLSLIIIDELIKPFRFFFYNMNVHAHFLNRNVLAL